MTELIIVLLIALIIFVVCRELVCWYWKINESIELQKKILNKLENLEKLQKLDDISYRLDDINRKVQNNEL